MIGVFWSVSVKGTLALCKMFKVAEHSLRALYRFCSVSDAIERALGLW